MVAPQLFRSLDKTPLALVDVLSLEAAFLSVPPVAVLPFAVALLPAAELPLLSTRGQSKLREVWEVLSDRTMTVTLTPSCRPQTVMTAMTAMTVMIVTIATRAIAAKTSAIAKAKAKATVMETVLVITTTTLVGPDRP
jgi:hypothetical protein